MIRIRRFRGLSGLEIGLATVLGVIGGIYVWKPIFIEARKVGAENARKRNDADDKGALK